MFLGKDGDRTIFQIMTRHGVDIGAFSVRAHACWLVFVSWMRGELEESLD